MTELFDLLDRAIVNARAARSNRNPRLLPAATREAEYYHGPMPERTVVLVRV